MKPKNFIKRFLAKISKSDGCWEWTASKKRGYGVIRNRIYQYHGRGGCLLAHRVAAAYFNGLSLADIQDKCIMHSCDNRGCVKPAHLIIGDRTLNAQDCFQKRRHAFGERNGRAKLTYAKAAEIRSTKATTNISFAALAARYSVTPRIVQLIVRNKIWKTDYLSAIGQ